MYVQCILILTNRKKYYKDLTYFQISKFISNKKFLLLVNSLHAPARERKVPFALQDDFGQRPMVHVLKLQHLKKFSLIIIRYRNPYKMPCIFPDRPFELTLNDCLACSGCLTLENKKYYFDLNEIKKFELDMILSHNVAFDLYHLLPLL